MADQPYTGPTYGLRAMGIPVYQADLDEGVNAEVRPGTRAIYVGQKGLTPAIAEHELTHLRQFAGRGIWNKPAVLAQNLLTIMRGQEPGFHSPDEEEAYARQAASNARADAEHAARSRQYRQDLLNALKSQAMSNRG